MGIPRVFCPPKCWRVNCKSAKPIENKGDEVFSLAPLADRGRKERTERADDRSRLRAGESEIREGWRGAAVKVTTKDRVYGE